MKTSSKYIAASAFFGQAAVVDLVTYATKRKKRFLLYTALNLTAATTFGVLAAKDKIFPSKDQNELDEDNLDEITKTVQETAAEQLTH